MLEVEDDAVVVFEVTEGAVGSVWDASEPGNVFVPGFEAGAAGSTLEAGAVLITFEASCANVAVDINPTIATNKLTFFILFDFRIIPNHQTMLMP